MEEVLINFGYGVISFHAVNAKYNHNYNYSPSAACVALLLLRIGKSGRVVRKTSLLHPKTETWMVPKPIITMIAMGASNTVPRGKLERIIAGLASEEEVSEETAIVNRWNKYSTALQAKNQIEYDIGKIHVKIRPWGHTYPDSSLRAIITLTNQEAISYPVSLSEREICALARNGFGTVRMLLNRAQAMLVGGRVFGFVDKATAKELSVSETLPAAPLTEEIKASAIASLKKGVPLSALIAMK